MSTNIKRQNARTGKQEYRKNEIFADSDDDSIIELDRPADEVFSEKTIASFENKPLVNEHPDEDVNTENYKDYAVGFIRDVHKGTVNGQDVLLANLVFTDKDAIEDIESGRKNELSCGYDCDIVDEKNPKQTNIRGNHVALCERGRAGIAKIVDSVKDYSTTKRQFREYDIDEENSWLATTEFGTPKGNLYLYRKNGKIVVKPSSYNWHFDEIKEFNTVKELNKWLLSDSINDMALSRTDAMDRCIALGKRFIEHFDKMYHGDKQTANHWLSEMDSWYKQVKQIKLKENNKEILKGDLRDWFFTAGANPQDFMTNPDYEELKAYDEFVEKVLTTNNVKGAYIMTDADNSIFYKAYVDGKVYFSDNRAELERLNPERIYVLEKDGDVIKDVNPRSGESKEDFISRFMSETKEEYPDEKQRLAVAYSYWKKGKGTDSMIKDTYYIAKVLGTEDYALEGDIELGMKKYARKFNSENEAYSFMRKYFRVGRNDVIVEKVQDSMIKDYAVEVLTGDGRLYDKVKINYNGRYDSEIILKEFYSKHPEYKSDRYNVQIVQDSTYDETPYEKQTKELEKSEERFEDGGFQEIGDFWRNLARKNKISSQQMDDLYVKFMETPVFQSWSNKDRMDIAYSERMFNEFMKFFKQKTGKDLIIDSVKDAWVKTYRNWSYYPDEEEANLWHVEKRENGRLIKSFTIKASTYNEALQQIKSFKDSLSYSDIDVIEDAIYWVKKSGKDLTVKNVLKQIEEDMSGFIGSNKNDIINYLKREKHLRDAAPGVDEEIFNKITQNEHVTKEITKLNEIARKYNANKRTMYQVILFWTGKDDVAYELSQKLNIRDASFNDANIKFIGFKIEFIEGRHNKPNNILSMNDVNNYLKNENAKLPDDYIGYDKCYVDMIFEVDGSKYNIHGARVDLSGKPLATSQLVSQDDVNYGIKTLERYLQDGNGRYGMIKKLDSIQDDRFGEIRKVANKNEIIRGLKSIRLDNQEDDLWLSDGTYDAQIQNRGLTTTTFSNGIWGKASHKESSYALGRIWKNDNLIFKEEGPVNVVRDKMIKYLQSTKDSKHIKAIKAVKAIKQHQDSKVKDDYSGFLGNYGFGYLKGSGDYEYWYYKDKNDINTFNKVVERIRKEYPSFVVSSIKSDGNPRIYIQKSKYGVKDSTVKDEYVKTPRGTFLLVNKTEEELRKEGYGYHHSGNGYKVFVKNNEAVAIKDSKVKDDNLYLNYIIKIDKYNGIIQITYEDVEYGAEYIAYVNNKYVDESCVPSRTGKLCSFSSTIANVVEGHLQSKINEIINLPNGKYYLYTDKPGGKIIKISTTPIKEK